MLLLVIALLLAPLAFNLLRLLSLTFGFRWTCKSVRLTVFYGICSLKAGLRSICLSVRRHLLWLGRALVSLDGGALESGFCASLVICTNLCGLLSSEIGMLDNTLGAVAPALWKFVALTKRQTAIRIGRQERNVCLKLALGVDGGVAPDAVDVALVEAQMKQHKLLGTQFFFGDLHEITSVKAGSELPT